MNTEQTFPTQLVGVEMKCGACPDGYMDADGIMLTSNPPQFPHTCKSCGATAIFLEKYPTYRVLRITEST